MKTEECLPLMGGQSACVDTTTKGRPGYQAPPRPPILALVLPLVIPLVVASPRAQSIPNFAYQLGPRGDICFLHLGPWEAWL